MFGKSLHNIFLLYAVINSAESGRKLIGFNFKYVSPTGHKQCLKLCISHADCLSVNFNRKRLLCELNSQDNDAVQVTENTEETEDFIYISRTFFPEDLALPQGELENLACPKGQMRLSRSTNETTCVISRCVGPIPIRYIENSATKQPDVSTNIRNKTQGNVGDSRNFTCPPGTVELGKTSTTCLANGEWETPRCQLEEFQLSSSQVDD